MDETHRKMWNIALFHGPVSLGQDGGHPQSVYTLHTQRLYGGEVLLSRIFFLLSVWFHSDILMLSPSLATSQMQSIRVPAGDVERHKRQYFNKLSLSLLLLVQEQTQAGGLFLTPLARMRLHGVRAVAPSTAEVVCKSDALKNRLAG